MKNTHQKVEVVMADDKDKTTILLAEYNNHSNWQRHNE